MIVHQEVQDTDQDKDPVAYTIHTAWDQGNVNQYTDLDQIEIGKCPQKITQSLLNS